METIFDHNPTTEELEVTGNNFRSRKWYFAHVDEETAWFDLALLFRERERGAIFRGGAMSICEGLTVWR